MKNSPSICLKAAILSIVGLAAVGPATAQSRNTECLLVPQARIAFGYEWTHMPWEARQFEKTANYGHEIEAGAATVVALRDYVYRGMDADEFTKVTLEFGSLALDKTSAVPLVAAPSRSYFAQGNSAFADSGAFWRIANPAVTVIFVPTMTAVRLKLNLRITMGSVAEIEVPRPSRIDFDRELTPKAVTDLNVWEGKPGKTFGAIVPPHL